MARSSWTIPRELPRQCLLHRLPNRRERRRGGGDERDLFFSALAHDWAVPAAPQHEERRLLHLYLDLEGGFDQKVRRCCCSDVASSIEAVQSLQFSGTKSFLAIANTML
jgi:hypothetical protein